MTFQSLDSVFQETFKWSYAGVIIPKLITPAIFLLLGRFLSPNDFGLIAIAYSVVSFVEITQQAGVSNAAIQSDADEKVIFNIIFFWNMSIGVVLYAMVYAGAPFVAQFFNKPESTEVIRVLGIQILISSFNLSYMSIIKRRIDFRKLFIPNIAPCIGLLLITLPLSYFGYGIWSLVAGYLSASVIKAIHLFISLPWRPSLKLNNSTFLGLSGFVLLCYLEGFIGWIYIWGDKVILGRFVPTDELGIYMFAYSATSSIINMAIFPIVQIVYPFLCRDKDFISENQGMYRLFGYYAFAAFFIAVLMLLLAEFIPIFIGDKWREAVFPFSILAISGAFSATITFIIPDAVRASGKAWPLLKFQFFKLTYTLPLLIYGAHKGGLIGFCIFKLISVIIGCFLFCFFAQLVIKLKVLKILQSILPSVIVFIFITGIGYLGKNYLTFDVNMVLKAVMFLLFGSFGYCLLLWLISPTFFSKLLSTIFNLLRQQMSVSGKNKA